MNEWLKEWINIDFSKSIELKEWMFNDNGVILILIKV